MRLDDRKKREIVDLLLRLPAADTSAGRAALVANMPGVLNRESSNAHSDLTLIVAQLEEYYGPQGEWRLLEVIDRAIAAVPGMQLAQELHGIRRQLAGLALAARAKAEEVGQVHLFDLRQPVLACVSQLSEDGGVSGFILPVTTPRTVNYFCDSVQHRGAEHGTWKRDGVTRPSAVVNVEPLRYPVEVAIRNACKFDRLLQKKSVLWAVHISTPEDATALWEGLQGKLTPAPGNHLVVVIGMNPDLAQAHGSSLIGTNVLPEPSFASRLVENWLRDIVEAHALDGALIQPWAASIMNQSSYDQTLLVDTFYENLELHSRMVVQKRNDRTALLQALNELIGG